MALTSLVFHCNETVQALVVAEEVAYSVNNFPNAAFISGMPYPMRSLGVLAILPDSRNAFTMRILLNSGKPCQRQVPNPAILGQAKEVPVPDPIVLLAF